MRSLGRNPRNLVGEEEERALASSPAFGSHPPIRASEKARGGQKEINISRKYLYKDQSVGPEP